MNTDNFLATFGRCLTMTFGCLLTFYGMVVIILASLVIQSSVYARSALVSRPLDLTMYELAAMSLVFIKGQDGAPAELPLALPGQVPDPDLLLEAQNLRNNPLGDLLLVRQVMEIDFAPYLGHIPVSLLVHGITVLLLGQFCLLAALIGTPVSRMLLAGYIAVMLVLEVAFIIVLYSGEFFKATAKSLQKLVDDEYRGVEGYLSPTSVTLNYLMLELGCCGIESAADFQTSQSWKRQKIVNNMTIDLVAPVPCCYQASDEYLMGSITGTGSATNLTAAIHDCLLTPNLTIDTIGDRHMGCFTHLREELALTPLPKIGLIVGITTMVLRLIALMCLIYSVVFGRKKKTTQFQEPIEQTESSVVQYPHRKHRERPQDETPHFPTFRPPVFLP